MVKFTLAVETSWEEGSLALFNDSEETVFSSWKKQASHSEVLTAEFNQMIRNRSLHDIKRIIVNVGPGSFTGIRVGLTFATTLAYSLKIPLIACNSLEVMAFKRYASEPTLVSIPAVRGHFYTAGYEIKNSKLFESLAPVSLSHEELLTAKNRYPVFVDGADPLARPTALDLSKFIGQKTRSFSETSWNYIKPLYLRRSEAEEKLNAGLLKPVYIEGGSSSERCGKKQDH